MLPKSYVVKCREHRYLIEGLIQHLRCRLSSDCPIARGLFEVGDYFHHPNLMEEGEVKIIREVTGLCGDIIYSDDKLCDFHAEECVLIPTEDQLRAGLEASSEYLADEAFRKGPERLLDEIVQIHRLSRAL